MEPSNNMSCPWHFILEFEVVWNPTSKSILYVLPGTTMLSNLRPCGVINVLVLAISLQKGALITTLWSLSVDKMGFDYEKTQQ